MNEIWFWMAKEIAELLVVVVYILAAWFLLYVISKIAKYFDKGKK